MDGNHENHPNLESAARLSNACFNARSMGFMYIYLRIYGRFKSRPHGNSWVRNIQIPGTPTFELRKVVTIPQKVTNNAELPGLDGFLYGFYYQKRGPQHFYHGALIFLIGPGWLQKKKTPLTYNHDLESSSLCCCFVSRIPGLVGLLSVRSPPCVPRPAGTAEVLFCDETALRIADWALQWVRVNQPV